MSEMILEESETVDGSRIATVRTKRGEEITINVDRAVLELCNLISDFDNEKRNDWTLTERWISDALSGARARTGLRFVPLESTP